MTFLEHLPVLMVITPLLAAPLVALARHAFAARLIASAAVFATACIAFGLVQWTGHLEAPLSYQLGGWAAPYGIEYRVTKASALVAALVSSVAFIAILAGTHFTRREVVDGRQHLFFAAYLLCLAGLLGMATTGDAFNVFVFLEISSLSTYTLVAMGRSRRAFSASFNYLVLGTIGGTFMLLGIGLLFQVTGSLNAADIAARISADDPSRTLHVAFAFVATGLAIKLAVFPLHQWLPGAYAESPSAVGAFLAGTATKVIYFQLIRAIVGLFGVAYVFEGLHFGRILAALSLLGMFGGSLSAVYQTSLKRLLAYSSIGQVGYLTLALSLGTEDGLSAGLLHLCAHGVTKSGLFLIVAAMVATVGCDRISRLRGYGKRHPVIAFGFVLGGIGLIGIPGTAGFVSKWALLRASLDSGHPLLAAAALVSSLIAVVYVWRVVETMYLQDPPANATPSADPTPSWKLAGPAFVLLGASIVMGVYSEPITTFVGEASAQLFRGAELIGSAP